MSSTVRIVSIFLLISAFMAAIAWVYKAGGDGARNSLERQNNEAARRADEGALDYDACRDAGGVFDFSALKCRRNP